MGAKVEKKEIKYSVALTVVKVETSYSEDSYDKSSSLIRKDEIPLASVDIAGPDWEILKAKLHAHIDLVG